MQYEECIVDAENDAERNSCHDGPPVAHGFTQEENPFEAVGAFFARFTHKPVKVDVEECIVDAENQDEIENGRPTDKAIDTVKQMYDDLRAVFPDFEFTQEWKKTITQYEGDFPKFSRTKPHRFIPLSHTRTSAE